MGEAVRTDNQDFPREGKERALGDSHGQAVIEAGQGKWSQKPAQAQDLLGHFAPACGNNRNPKQWGLC